jgi:hypothetical protein
MLSRLVATAVLITMGLCGLSPVDGQILNGRVKNATTGELISGATLMIKGTTIGTATGSDGLFSLSLSGVPAVLVVSHLSYKTLEITFTTFPEGKIDITLEPAVHDLGEVRISSERVQQLMPGKPWEILDYEFMDEDLLLLANMNGSMFQPCLILANQQGDTLSRLKISNAEELYRDFEGNVYLVSDKAVLQVRYSDKKLTLSYSGEKEMFFATYPAVVDLKQPWWILRSYGRNGQKIDYIRFNEDDSTYNTFRTVANQDAIDRSYWGPYFDGTEADAHFARVIINRPVYAPLFRSGDELVLFNYYDRAIEFYDGEGEMSRMVPSSFMKDKRCKEQVLQDRVSGMFYVVFEKNGITSLCLIGLVDGSAEIVDFIPGFAYVENLQIRNGVVYFLYREKNLEEQKRLYKMVL